MTPTMKTQAEIDAGNQYGAYQQGWRAGAAFRAMDLKAAEHESFLIRDAYNQGYTDGRHAYNQAMHNAARKYNYKISVLRLMDDAKSEEKP
jgi:hypothetical protein